jgi:hypothetical protein
MTLRQDLVRGREAVEAYRRQATQLGDEWGEEPATIQFLYALGSRVRFVQFNKRQEGELGADWMWWWRAQSGESYGMLVQAKRIKQNRGEWSFDLGYPNRTDRQIGRLLDAARTLDIAAAYVLYSGDGSLRRGFGCTALRHEGDDCSACLEMAVALAPALLIRDAISVSRLARPGSLAEDTLAHAQPIEALPSDRGKGPVWSSLGDVCADIRELMALPQSGAREVARGLLRAVVDWKGFQHGVLAPPAIMSIGKSDHIFHEYPVDRASSGDPEYFRRLLGGLRRELPDFVEQILASQQAPTALGTELAGVAVIEC